MAEKTRKEDSANERTNEMECKRNSMVVGNRMSAWNGTYSKIYFLVDISLRNDYHIST